MLACRQKNIIAPYGTLCSPKAPTTFDITFLHVSPIRPHILFLVPSPTETATLGTCAEKQGQEPGTNALQSLTKAQIQGMFLERLSTSGI